jgi:hypothetical protein
MGYSEPSAQIEEVDGGCCAAGGIDARRRIAWVEGRDGVEHARQLEVAERGHRGVGDAGRRRDVRIRDGFVDVLKARSVTL